MQEHGCQARVSETPAEARVATCADGPAGQIGISAADWAAIGRLVLSETQRRTRDELRRRESGWRPSPFSSGEVLS